MKIEYEYYEIFQRNIGIFTKEEQEKIRNSTVFIAGTGGTGSPTAIAVMRLGVKKLIITDFDIYSPSNLNRQLISKIDKIRQSKVKVLGEHLKGIHPYTEVVVVEGGLNSGNADELVSQSDIVIGAMDGFMAIILERTCKKHKKLLVTSALIKERVMATTFPHDGIFLSDYYPFEIDESNPEKTQAEYQKFMSSMVKREIFKEGYAPTISAGIFIAGGIMSFQVAYYLARNTINIPSFPTHLIFDSENMTMKHKLKILDKIRKNKILGPIFKTIVNKMAKKRFAKLK